MCARSVAYGGNIYQQDLIIRDIIKNVWPKGYFISGFYVENNILYMFWPRDLKQQFWNLPTEGTFGTPFELDWSKKMEEVNLFWLINYYPDKDPEPQPYVKDKSLIKFDYA